MRVLRAEPVTPRSALPLADPVLDTPAEFQANRTTSWTEGDARLMLLEGDVTFAMGTYGFRGDRAAVRIDLEPKPGRLIRHLSIYLDNARPLHGRGPVQAESPRLLVTASTTGGVELATDLMQNKSAADDKLVVEGQGRFKDFLASIQRPVLDVPPGIGDTAPQAVAIRQRRHEEIAAEAIAKAQASLTSKEPPARAAGIPAPTSEVPATTAATTQTAAAPATAAPRLATPAPAAKPAGGKSATTKPSPESPPILPASGVVSFGADRVVFEPTSKTEATLVLIGHVRVLYQNYQGKAGATLSAESAVIFIAGEKLSDLTSGRIKAGDIHGVYLEDNVVVTYERFTVRAPRVFYDLSRNKAVILDAVMYTWDVRRQVPIYVRAEMLRQESADTWTARRAAVTTSEFAVPHIAIAARQVTIHQETVDGAAVTKFDARDATARLGTLPLFYWPEMSGDASGDMALRRIDVGYSKQHGPLFKTTWDLFTLFGKEKPAGVQLDGKVDYLGQHGAAGGINLDYDRAKMFGSLDAYIVAHDTGQDEIGGRSHIDFNGDTRGYALWRHRAFLPDHWELSLEAAYVSDETFLEEFFRRQAEESKPYETSAYLKKQEDDWAFTVLAKYNINNFVSQTTTLQAPGYTVDKLPELGYFREATSLWGDRLTYYSETRASRMRIRFNEDRPIDRGFTDAQSQLLFGIPRSTPFDEGFEDQGVPGDYRVRFDTRHEVDAPLKAGIFDVTPYLAGRFTGYDQDFSPYANESEQIRLWGSVGARLSTEFSKSYAAESPLLDLHRLRHLIEPNADLFLTGSTIPRENLPVFDPDVENISDGPGVKLGIKNTFQTQRGGEGRWRNVDWLVINTDLILRDHEPNEDAIIPRMIDYRPEYSLGGDHFHGDALWQISDTLAAVGEVIKNLETGRLSEWRVGLSMQHTPDLATFVDYTDLDVLSSRLLSFGFTYRLTRKYTVALRQTVDLGGGNNRTIDISLTRKLPRWQLVVIAKIDEVDNDQTFAVVLIPDGINVGRLADPLGTLRGRD